MDVRLIQAKLHINAWLENQRRRDSPPPGGQPHARVESGPDRGRDGHLCWARVEGGVIHGESLLLILRVEMTKRGGGGKRVVVV